MQVQILNYTQNQLSQYFPSVLIKCEKQEQQISVYFD
jgi:hypothetical protein